MPRPIMTPEGAKDYEAYRKGLPWWLRWAAPRPVVVETKDDELFTPPVDSDYERIRFP